MTGQVPRIAFFPDSFHEVNGVAHTSRHFEQFAREHSIPFLCVRAGSRAPKVSRDGTVWTLELPRSAFSIPLERDLTFDPVYLRHLPLVDEAIQDFAPDVVHVTGPSDVGVLGASMARYHKIPLAASWHTNVHEYAARRFAHLLRVFPQTAPLGAAKGIEECAMMIAAHFYSAAGVLFAPNRQLCGQLEELTGLSCFLMRRGVDCTLFNPGKRKRGRSGREFVLGFVGRLSVEKNVRMLARVQNELERLGRKNFHFMIVGHGSEQDWLRRNLPRAEFTGVLKGEALAEAYADMDLFIFPSHTDTFGNVVLEALASGVPAIVTPDGGPASIVRDGETGRVASEAVFAQAIEDVLEDVALHCQMGQAARRDALSATWNSVFSDVLRGYRHLTAQPSHDPSWAATN
ncbi:glycosyltransferase [Occallatibacter savannae]|uniref:glycosyltransferase n=1 Tax=Occallatibacter savannae TaxID=1002691 RepID=UPI000D69B913|nr:glycosyltransferase [Occallatibacter savannae]